MSVLYVSALFSSYKPLNFGNSFYPGVFLCGVHCNKSGLVLTALQGTEKQEHEAVT